MDFTFKTYQSLLSALQSRGFSFITVSEYAATASLAPRPLAPELRLVSVVEPSRRPSPFILLRHDVEAKYENALQMARLQHSRGIRGTYYFRIYGKNGHSAVIREIAALGHEIGYHYDDLSHCKGDYEKAIRRFEENLTYLRQFGPVTSATMEGAPLSRYDNRMLWLGRLDELVEGSKYVVGSKKYVVGESGNKVDTTKPESKSRYLLPTYYYLNQHNSKLPKYNYKDNGILTEPYFDFNFNQLYYLTDTGRRWDGHLYNVRDKATKENPVTNPAFLGLRFHSTRDIIQAINGGSFPEQAMLNFHPQRWNDGLFPWLKELVWQNVKNQGKRVLVNFRR